MPNVAPRGLFGRSGSSWKPPVNVWARVSGAWKQADNVFVYHNGQWQLIWSRVAAAPATATATWVAPGTVRIDWTPPTINPNLQWVIRRSDGSTVGTVAVGVLTITDTNPRTNSTTTANTVIPPYTVEGVDGSGESSATRATNSVTFNLTPATFTAVASYPNTTDSTVTLTWTPNATYGAAQGWQAYLDGIGFQGAVVPGTTTSLALSRTRGVVEAWRIVPMTNIDGTWVQAGNVNPITVNVKAADPVNVNLVATNPPMSNLRLTWAHPSGSRTGYEIQHFVSPSGPWTAHATVGSTVTQSDWNTTVAGSMRVRTLAAGGPSDWVQLGPVTPVVDLTPPGPSTITSWKPEASYGRMVGRGNYSSDADVATAAIYYRVNGGLNTIAQARGPVTPGAAFVIVPYTASGGQIVDLIVRTWDAAGNVNSADAIASYTVVVGTGVFNPTDGWTGRGGAWRTDAGAGQYALLQGLTSAGENAGYIFYGDQLTNYLVGRTFQGGWVDVWRANDQGSSAAIQSGLVAHQWDARPAVPPMMNNGGAECLGAALTRTGTGSTGSDPICTGIANLIAAGWKGLAMYRPNATSSDPNNPSSFYMKYGLTGQTSGDRLMGRVVLTSLG